jgi:hypothetical protein
MLNEHLDVPEYGRIGIRKLLPQSISTCAGHSGAFVELFSIHALIGSSSLFIQQYL